VGKWRGRLEKEEEKKQEMTDDWWGMRRGKD
jgi:hypothetical protein